MKQKHFRTIWVSDVHLGTSGCRAEELRAFLKAYTCDRLYLVGDIIDGWALEKRWFWPGTHTQVVRQIMRKAEKENTEVIYVAGNHDEFLRDLLEEHRLDFGNIKIVNDHIHTCANNKSLWVVHGDHYDIVLKHYKTIERLGDFVYEILLLVSNYYDSLRRKYSLRRFFLINYLKKKVRMVEKFTRNFEEAISKETNIRGLEGVISGHIHRAASKTINGVEYWNCGDWVESCTAIVEDENGNMSVVEWAEEYDKKGNAGFVLRPYKEVKEETKV